MVMVRRNYREIDIIRVIEPLLLGVLCLVFFITLVQAGSADAVWPEAPGMNVLVDGNLLMDCSNDNKGYVMAGVMTPTGSAFKLQVTFNGGQLLYDLDSTGLYTTIPLQLGSGTYNFALFEGVGGGKFAGAGNISLTVQLDSEDAAFLVPNQYVDYVRETASVLKSDELSEGKGTADVYNEVCNFMSSEFSYDFARAASIAPGTLPEIDSCFANRAGICQDLSAVMISMLRVQGIPSRLVIGYADGYYHAWTVSVVDGQEVFFDPTAAVGAISAGSYVTERIY